MFRVLTISITFFRRLTTARTARTARPKLFSYFFCLFCFFRTHKPGFNSKFHTFLHIIRIITICFAFLFSLTSARTAKNSCFRHLPYLFCFFRAHKPGRLAKINTLFHMLWLGTIDVAFLFVSTHRRFNAFFQCLKHHSCLFFFLCRHKSILKTKLYTLFHMVWVITISIAFLFSLTSAWSFPSGLTNHSCFFRAHKPGRLAKSNTFFKMFYLRAINITLLFSAARRWFYSFFNRY